MCLSDPKETQGQMGICGAYWHTKVCAGLWALSESQVPVTESMLALWLSSLPPSLPTPHTLPGFLVSNNSTIVAIPSLFCLHLLVLLSQSPLPTFSSSSSLLSPLHPHPHLLSHLVQSAGHVQFATFSLCSGSFQTPLAALSLILLSHSLEQS